MNAGRTSSYSGTVEAGIDLIPLLKLDLLNYYKAQLLIYSDDKNQKSIYENKISTLETTGFVIQNISMEVNPTSRFSINYEKPSMPNTYGQYNNNQVRISSLIFTTPTTISALAYNF